MPSSPLFAGLLRPSGRRSPPKSQPEVEAEDSNGPMNLQALCNGPNEMVLLLAAAQALEPRERVLVETVADLRGPLGALADRLEVSEERLRGQRLHRTACSAANRRVGGDDAHRTRRSMLGGKAPPRRRRPSARAAAGPSPPPRTRAPLRRRGRPATWSAPRRPRRRGPRGRRA